MAFKFFALCFAFYARYGSSTPTPNRLDIGVKWRIAAASAVGTSHVVTNSDCQDSCLVNVELLPTGEPLLSIFVADGAGSAQYGGEGAELAIETSADFLLTKLVLPNFSLSQELAIECVTRVRDCIYEFADKKERKSRDYACTFLGVLSSLQGTLLMQIGDGGIVIDVGNGLEIPVTPMSGEYANMTHFVTDDDAVDVLVSKYFPKIASRVAVFTDGIQRLALNMAENIPHEPFFSSFFNVLSIASDEQEEQLNNALSEFLNSKAVNERTDDDKTLVLALLLE